MIAILLHGCGLIFDDGKWGYINKEGRWVIGPAFQDPPGRFRSGVAPVTKIHGRLYIDSRGHQIAGLPKDQHGFCDEVSDGLVLVRSKKPETIHKAHCTSADFNYDYYNLAGNKVLSLDVTDAGGFREGLAPAQFRERAGDKYPMWGYVDKQGNTVISPQFSSASEFSCGLAVVEIGAHNDEKGYWEHGKYGYVDKKGDFAIAPKFTKAHSFTESGLAAVEENNGLWHFIDRTGKKTFDGRYAAAGDFADGCAPVRDGRKWGFVDTSGRWLHPPSWDDAQSFSEGLAAVGMDTGRFEDDVSQTGAVYDYGYVDRHFRVLIPPQFSAARPFSEGLAAVRVR